jgi:hypothetical protein
VAVGLVYGASVTLSYWNKPTTLWSEWCSLVLMGPLFLLRGTLFDAYVHVWGWGYASQYFSIAMVSAFGFGWAFRDRIIQSNLQRDVEQLVGPERGQSVL